jgi:hypothetical protein
MDRWDDDEYHERWKQLAWAYGPVMADLILESEEGKQEPSEA